MQIPTNFSTAQAASIASAVSNRDKAAASENSAAVDAAQLVAQLEKSESPNPDRDAQGQGDGFGEHLRKQQDENEVAPEPVAESAVATPTASVPDSDRDLPPALDLVC